MGKTFKMDMTPLTDGQKEIMKEIIQVNQIWLDHVKQMMINHGLWDKGFVFRLSISPEATALTEEIKVYRTVVDGEAIYEESINRHKGTDELFKDWKTLSPCTSREFIHLFDDEKSGAGSQDGKADEKPLPPNGLWIGTDPYSGVVDGGQ